MFSGEGWTDMPLALGCYDEKRPAGMSTNCLMANNEINFNLSSPVTIEPVSPYYTWMDDYREERCPDRSDYPAWTVQNLVYDHAETDPESGLAKNMHELSFDVLNLSTEERISCAVSVDDALSLQNTRTEHWVECVTPEKKDSTIVYTEVMFDVNYSLLGIKQSWKCSDAIEGLDAYVKPIDIGARANMLIS